MDFSALNPRTTNALNSACRDNKVVLVCKLLASGKNPNVIDNRGWAAIHEAAANGSFECLKELLAHPLTMTLAETFEGHTALFLACQFKRSIQIINLLLKCVENIAEYCSNEIVSPLHIVSGQGRSEVVEILIKHGAIVDLQDFDGDTSLHEAARRSHPKVMSILLHAGAEPEIKNSYGLTPFLLACFKGHLECVMEVFPFVSDINEAAYDGNTALILAAQSGALDVVKFLLMNDANPDKPNNDGSLPLYEALTNGHTKVFQWLLPVTDINVINRNLMNYACKPLYFSMGILLSLLESDLYPEFFNESEDFHGILEKVFGVKLQYSINPPLCAILNVIDYIYKSSSELCETLLFLLLTKGVSVNPLNNDECPPLVYLHFCDHIESYDQVIKIFVQHDCNIDHSTTPLIGKLQIPDAVIASILSNGHTLPTLIQYSLNIDPEDIINILIKHDMIGKKVSPEIIAEILQHCWLAHDTLEELRRHLEPFFKLMNNEFIDKYSNLLKNQAPNLKHLCRRSIRSMLRYNNFDTRQFLSTLKRLPIPYVVQKYLRYA